MKFTPREPKSNVNVSPTSPLRELLSLSGGLIAIVVVIYFFLGFAVDLMVPHIPQNLEKKMATLVLHSVDAKDLHSERQIYVQSLLDNLQGRCARLPYHFKVHIHESPAVNALALPGGHILVFTGLLNKMASENELAFVMAHEMGHYAHKDHLRGVGRAIIFVAISATLFGPDSGVSKMLAHGMNLTEMSFSRKQETRADEFPLETLNCAYGHVAGAIDFFAKLPTQDDNGGELGHYFSSHPETHQRISHLKEWGHLKGFRLAPRKPLPKELKR